MPSVKREVTPISGEEAGRRVILDLCRQYYNAKRGLPEMEGRFSPAELSDMLYGLPTQADADTYNDYRALHNYLGTIPITLLALNRGAEFALSQSYYELLLHAAAQQSPENDLLAEHLELSGEARHSIFQRIGVFNSGFHESQVLNTLLDAMASALELPELESLKDPPSLDHLSGYCALALELGGLPLINVNALLVNKRQLSRAKSAMRSKGPFLKRVEKATQALIETDG